MPTRPVTQPSRRSIGAQRNPETRDAVLDAAEQVLTERGLSGFTIEAVARAARAGKPTIYKWWGSKAALLLEVYDRNKIAEFHPNTGSVRRDVAGLLVNLMDHWEGSSAGPVFRSIVAEAQANADARHALDAYLQDLSRYIAVMIGRGIPRGELPPEADCTLMAEMISALALQRLLSGRSLSVKEAGLTADTLLAGFTQPA